MINNPNNLLDVERAPQGDILPNPEDDFPNTRLPTLPNAPLTGWEVVAAASWTGLRDGVAVFVASGLTLGIHVGVRAAFQAGPVVSSGVSMSLNTFAIGGATYVFVAGEGTPSWRPCRRWLGAGAAALSTALYLYSLAPYWGRSFEGALQTAFINPFYNGLRETGQGLLGRVLPEMGLDPRYTFCWEGGDNTTKHACRLAINVIIYAAISTALSRYVAVRSLLSPDFNTADQELNDFVAESFTVISARTATEMLDTFFSVVSLACCFRRHSRRQRAWLSNQTNSAGDTLRRTASRTSVSMLFQVFQSLLPRSDWFTQPLQGLTALRGSFYSARRNPWVLAQNTRTEHGEDCLLHAADGHIHNHRWVCAEPQRLRAQLRTAIRELARNENREEEGKALVKHHLQQAVIQLCATDGMAGFVDVPNGERLLDSLPHRLRQELTLDTSLNARQLTAGRWLAIPENRDALLRSVASYYEDEDVPLTHHVVPCLARILRRSIAVHMADADLIYDREGTLVPEPFNDTVHIRQAMLGPEGMAGDHFERVAKPSSHGENMASENDLVNIGMRVEMSQMHSTLEISDLVPLNGDREEPDPDESIRSGANENDGPRSRTTTNQDAPTIRFPAIEGSRKKSV